MKRIHKFEEGKTYRKEGSGSTITLKKRVLLENRTVPSWEVIDEHGRPGVLSEILIRNFFTEKGVKQKKPNQEKPQPLISRNDKRISEQVRRLHCIYGRELCCMFCGETDPLKLSADHVTPKSRGGGGSVSNLIILCKRCNSLKGNMTIEELRDLIRHLLPVLELITQKPKAP